MEKDKCEGNKKQDSYTAQISAREIFCNVLYGLLRSVDRGSRLACFSTIHVKEFRARIFSPVLLGFLNTF